MRFPNLRINLSVFTLLLVLIHAPVTLSDQISNTSTVTAKLCPPHFQCFKAQDSSAAVAILVRPPDFVVSLENKQA